MRKKFRKKFVKTFYEKKKVIDFFDNFFYFYKSDIKIFLKQSIKKFPKSSY